MGPLSTNTPAQFWMYSQHFIETVVWGCCHLWMFVLSAEEAEDFLIRTAKDGMMSVPSGRWLSKVVIWDVKKNKTMGEDTFPLHTLLNKGMKREGPGFCPSCSMACCQVGTSSVSMWVQKTDFPESFFLFCKKPGGTLWERRTGRQKREEPLLSSGDQSQMKMGKPEVILSVS